jgi:tetratricopeptide (TPR) repeat protein
VNKAILLLGSVLLATTTAQPAMAIDLAPLWDFSRPELSEQRFKQALQNATGDDALILQTQIARTHGLRKNFDTARQLLRQIEADVAKAGPEAQVRYQLELGRSYASATHSAEQLTPDNKARARKAYDTALAAARAAQLDALAIDVVHMFAFLDTAPAEQLKWGQTALDMVLASSQPDARRWEASVRNNVAYALHQLGRYEEALAQFRQALTIRERGSNAGATRVAHWMVAWTLRSLKRWDEALAIQLRLEKENADAGQPDPYVFEELEALYKAKGEAARAEHYAQLHKAAVSKP